MSSTPRADGPPRRGSPRDDGLVIASLSGQSAALSRSVSDPWGPDAVEEIRALVAGRSDLLSQCAGILLGAKSYPLSDDWSQVVSNVRLLVAAGADLEPIPGWARIGRERVMRAGRYMREWDTPIPDIGLIVAGLAIPEPASLPDHRGGWVRLVIHPIFPGIGLDRASSELYARICREFGKVSEGIDYGCTDRTHDNHRAMWGLYRFDAEQRLLKMAEAAGQMLPHEATAKII